MKTRHAARRFVAGFTLIELLTVIAIIGILAAIIIPTVGQVRKSAYKAKSTSNLRQLAVAANIYASETKGNYYPPVNGFNALGQVDYGKPWSNDVSFTRYFSIKPDPVNPWLPGDGSIVKSGFPVSPWPNEQGRATIGYNATDIYDYSAPSYLRDKQAIKQSDVRNPGRLLMFAEAVDYKIGYNGRTGWTPAHDTGDNTNRTDLIAYRASEKAIIVTYSGAVRLLSRTEADDKTIWSNFSPTTP